MPAAQGLSAQSGGHGSLSPHQGPARSAPTEGRLPSPDRGPCGPGGRSRIPRGGHHDHPHWRPGRQYDPVAGAVDVGVPIRGQAEELQVGAPSSRSRHDASPAPPVNTTASRSPREAAMAARCSARLSQCTPVAGRQAGFRNSGPGGYDQAGQGREPHGGVGRSAVPGGRQRGTPTRCGRSPAVACVLATPGPAALRWDRPWKP